MTRRIPYLDLRVKDQEKKKRILSRIEKVLDHGRMIEGPEVIEFERSVASYCHSKYAIGVSSGSGALYMSLLALGIGAGDEVILPALSWIATAHAVKLLGATPVFVDIGENLNISIQSTRKMITEKTKAIIAVHFMGVPAPLDELRKISSENELVLIEDASQAFGSHYKGYPIGYESDLACFSLNPMKTLGALGEAGVILTNSESLKKRLELLRYCGVEDKIESVAPSLNFRMDTILAAALIEELEEIDSIIDRRESIAAQYKRELPKALITPNPDERCSFYGYTLLVPSRDGLLSYLSESGIEAKVKHEPLMSDHLPYRDCKRDDSVAKRLIKRVISLPNHQYLTKSDVQYICEQVKSFYENSDSVE